MTEVRNMNEGSVMWVQASGSGTAWATASAPQSGLFAYVRSFSWTSAQQYNAVMDRGRPTHWKAGNKQPIQITMSCAWTGGSPTAATASGASVPLYHFEYKADMPESAGAAIFYQFCGVPIASMQLSDGDPENTLQLTMQALAMFGPTASGYMMAG